jgi:hypothetical protein
MSLAAAYMFGRKQGVALQKLLDQFPNAAVAFSVKKIRNAYSGNCMKVRRASDNTTLDIGFSGDDLDTSSLQTFCAGTDGFVETWYNQSGTSAVATQTVLANQPKIVTSGSVILKDGIPAISSDGVDDFMNVLNGESFFVTEYSFFSAFAYKVKAAEQRIFSYINTSNASFFIFRKTGGNLQNFALGAGGVDVLNSQDLQRLIVSKTGKKYDSIKIKTDTSSIFVRSIANWQATSGGYLFKLFSARNGGLHAETLSQQFVFYDADQTSNIQAIEDNIKTTFNI